MKHFQRSLTAGLIVLSGLAFAGSRSVGAFFDVPLTPGHFHSTESYVFAGMSDAAGDNVSVAVNYGRLLFRPKGGSSRLIPVNGTAIYVSLSAADGVFGFGCWLLTGNGSTVNRDLSATATFDSSAPNVSPCPGLLVRQTLTAAAPQLMNLDEDQGLTGPVRFSFQWNPSQPVDVQHSVINGTCQDWASLDQMSYSDVFTATAGELSATVAGVNFSTGQFETVPVQGHFDTAIGGIGEVTAITHDEVVNGPSTGNCGPYGT